jgi:hypothetical protein
MKTEISIIIEAELNSHLYPNESSTDFIQRVCQIYLCQLRQQKGFTTPDLLKEVMEEVEIEAMDIFRMKTYGHYNLASYRLLRNNDQF